MPYGDQTNPVLATRSGSPFLRILDLLQRELTEVADRRSPAPSTTDSSKQACQAASRMSQGRKSSFMLME